MPATSTSDSGGPPTVSVALCIMLVIIIFFVVYFARRVSLLKQNLRASLPRERMPARRRGISRGTLEALPIVQYDAGVVTRHHGLAGIIKLQLLRRQTRTTINSNMNITHPGCDAVESSPRNKAASWFQRHNTSHSKTNQSPVMPSCAICADDFTDGVPVRKLPCKHIFHPTCIDPWLLDRATTCPLWYVNIISSPRALGIIEY